MAYTSEKLLKDLSDVVKGEVSIDIFNRLAFSTDASIYQIIPACVVWPADKLDIVAVVKYAARNSIPIVARGAGSGVAGESLGSGIVIDITRYMNRIIGYDKNCGEVVCEPGVVLDDLNEYLLPFGVKIGPDPSSANRAVIGGVVANNATGAHSLQYGYIADYVESIEAVLADGSIVKFTNNYEPDRTCEERVDEISRACLLLLKNESDVIAKALPRTKRNRSGYNIAGICRNKRVDMAKLLAGSEGTLAIFTKIMLKTVNLPKAKSLLQLEFNSFELMAKAVPIIVQSGATACELMDHTLISMARDAFPAYRDILPADAAAVLLVEHIGSDGNEVMSRIKATDSAVSSLAAARMVVTDNETQKRLWKSRKDAVPLLNRQKGHKHPIPFIEDVSVDSSKLAEYIEGLADISKRYGIEMSYYGHAGDGELHIRPYLDLGRPEEVEKMKQIANDVFTLAWSLGGSISGEHADGLVRAAFIKRQYGREFYDLLVGIKKIFDSKGLLNPGKIINDNPDVMTTALKAENKPLADRLNTNLFFEPDEFYFEIEQCNGDAECRSTNSQWRMCPVFRAVPDELSCSRAKANLLRSWITGLISEGDFESPEFKRVLDRCINCRMCSLQCPAGVDISKLVIEARAEYVRRKGLTRAEFALSRNRYLSAAGALFAPLSGFVMKLTPFKWLLEKFVGLDRRRSLPNFQRGTFLDKSRKYLSSAAPISQPMDKVAYFVDSYANYNDHELGFAVIKCLRHNNIDVILPQQLPVPFPAIVYGDVKNARKDLAYSVKYLAEAVRQGYKIICSEPSAALCLKNELRYFVDSEDAKLVSENTYELMGYLLELFKQGKLQPADKSDMRNFLYHSPCHLCAFGGAGASVELLRGLCDIAIEDINAGCCGLAGTFGMQKKNFELSVKISEQVVDTLKSSPVEYAATECAACRMQIEQLTDKKVFHPIKILADAYKLD